MGGGGALEFPPPLSPSAPPPPPPPPPPVGCISCLMQSVVCSSPNSFSLKMSCLGICVSLQESVLSYAQLYQESLRSLVSYAHYISMQCIMPLPLVYVVACRRGTGICFFPEVCIVICHIMPTLSLHAVYNATASEGNVIAAFLLLMAINVLFAVIASAFIVLEVSQHRHPVSGIYIYIQLSVYCIHIYMNITSAMLSILGERERPHWLWSRSHGVMYFMIEK